MDSVNETGSANAQGAAIRTVWTCWMFPTELSTADAEGQQWQRWNAPVQPCSRLGGWCRSEVPPACAEWP